LTRFFQILLQTDDDLRRKPDPRIHLEMGLLRLINAARLAPLEELMAEMKNGGAGGSAPPSAGTRGSSAAPAVRGAAAGSSAANASAAAASVGAAVIHSQAGVAARAAASFEAVVEKANGTVRPPATTVRSTEMHKPADEPVPDSPKANGSAVQVQGITIEQVAEIKAAIQVQQKFVAELIEHASRWELEGAELRLCFSPDKQTFAALLDGRDTLEKIRAASSKVLGRSVRVCGKIESVAAVAGPGSAGGSSTQELRERFERDPMVRSMLQRFGGKITEVRRRQEES
jgi:DNA polymerase-3 subunit gamma/tau